LPFGDAKSLGASGVLVAGPMISGVLLAEWVPCFTAWRARGSTKCRHAYASDVALEKSREHVSYGALSSRATFKPRKHGTLPDIGGRLSKYCQLILAH